MKALIQRVRRGRVSVDGQETGSIGQGLVILLGVMPEDDERIADYLADRCAGLRIFEDENGKMNRSLLDIGGGSGNAGASMRRCRCDDRPALDA